MKHKIGNASDLCYRFLLYINQRYGDITTMAKSNFFEKISCSTQESQVQETYNEMFKSVFKINTVDRKCQCDGYFETKTSDNKEISVLIEYKYDIHMKDRVQRSKVIAQCLGYLKQFEQSGEKLPKLVFIGDINECCIIHTNDLLKLLDLENVDWSVAPSSMSSKNIDLVFNIAKDISPWVYDVDEDFKFQDVTDKIIDLCNNVSRKLHITEKNIEKVYNLFCDRVIKDKKKVQANDLVSTFIGTMLDSEHYYQHPRKKNILVANDKQVVINGDEFELFMQMHSTEYSPKEKRIMTAISDRLIEDTNRRNKGEFYTPTLFVDYAHGMIEKELGQHWKENYVVWDCCCGTKNLTRDYRFKELYCSTLEQAELDISKNYNKEATSFQFDFLNDSLDDLKVKAPGLLEAFELNKPIVFFLNPPYGKASGITGATHQNTNLTNEAKKQRVNISDTANGFIYRIVEIANKYNLTNCSLCIFNKMSYLQSPLYKCNRLHLFNTFGFISGCIVNGKIFNNVANGLGISFNIFKTNHSNKHVTLDVLNDDMQPIMLNRKYDNFDDKTLLLDWCRSQDSNKNNYACVMKNALELTDNRIRVSNKFIGGLLCHGNDVYNSVQLNAVFSGMHNHSKFEITTENFLKCMTEFSVKSLNACNISFYNDRSQFTAPDVEPTDTFMYDCMIFSLFNSKSYQSSIKSCNIKCKNEFFWMSKQEMLDLAEKYNNDYTYEDALNSEERFVYLKLQEIKNDLSLEAKAVLDKATDLVKSSFKYREMFNESHPEYQINNWDCGFYQIKALLKEFMPDDLKEFRVLYKQLADKMRPMIYELGFLK